MRFISSASLISKTCLAMSVIALNACGPVTEDKPYLAPEAYNLLTTEETGFSEAHTLLEGAAKLEAYLGIGKEPAEGRYETDTRYTLREDLGVGLVTINEDYLPDDSVKGRQLDAIFEIHEDRFVLKQAGTRHKCWRAEDPEAWTTKPCP